MRSSQLHQHLEPAQRVNDIEPVENKNINIKNIKYKMTLEEQFLANNRTGI